MYPPPTDSAPRRLVVTFLLCVLTGPRAAPGAGRRVLREKLYFVMNTIYEVINFMQTSKDESKSLYKL